MIDKETELRAKGEAAVIGAITAMDGSDRLLAEQVHEIVKTNAPGLISRTWYGMPAYANADGKIVCFFQTKQRFKTRYATLGFQHDANLDDGDMWPVAYALMNVGDKEIVKITELVKKAVG